MKTLKIIMSVLAWLGLVIILLITIPTFFYETSSMWRIHTSARGIDGSAGQFYVNVLVYFGMILTLLFGFIAKPRYLWLGMIIIGLTHIIGFSGFYNLMYYQGINTWDMSSILPGFLLIGSGFLLRKMTRKHA